VHVGAELREDIFVPATLNEDTAAPAAHGVLGGFPLWFDLADANDRLLHPDTARSITLTSH